MNCQKFEEVVSDLAREQILDAGLRSAALAHSRDCQPCAIRLEDEIAITVRLKKFAGAFSTLGPSALVETKLLDVFAARRSNVTPMPNISQTSRGLWYGAAGIAALLLIVFGLALIRSHPLVAVKENANDSPAVQSPPLGLSRSALTNTGPDDQHQLPIREKRQSAVKRNRPLATSITNQSKPRTTSEIATDFIPVTYGGAANLAEGGRMVRVELPRSAMASFGLPVNMDRANEKVKADVLLGVDGLAHAIRFVR
jgi:hypothetical protein